MAKETSIIKARRGGAEKTFTRQTWDLLPADKEGWEELKSNPAELESKTGSPAKEPKQPAAKKEAAPDKPKVLTGAAKVAADKKALLAQKEQEKTGSPAKNPDDVAANIATGEEGSAND